MAVPFKTLQGSVDKTCIALLGKMKDGKTTCGLSLSEKFDSEFKGPQMLDDIGVITTEPDAMQGPKLMGVDVKYWLDLTDYTDKGQKVFEDSLADALKTMQTLALEGKIKGLLFDSVSTLDKTWKAYLSKQYEKWGLIDAILVKHRSFLVERILPLPVPSVLTFHTRTVSAALDAAKKESLGLDTGDIQLIDVTGWDAPSLYRGQCSYILPIKKTEVKGKPADYSLYPNGVNGIEAGGRYGLAGAPEKLPANLRNFLSVIKKSAQST